MSVRPRSVAMDDAAVAVTSRRAGTFSEQRERAADRKFNSVNPFVHCFPIVSAGIAGSVVVHGDWT